MFCKLKYIVEVLFKYPSESILVGSFFSAVFIIHPLFRFIAQYLFAASSRPDVPNHHQKKDNTPTMGGIAIGVVLFSMMLLSGYITINTVLLSICYLLFALIGACDDLYKIYRNEGITARTKFIAQFVCALSVVLIWFFALSPDTRCVIPFFNYYLFDWGYGFILWAMLVIVACSNAVNITDGLDGLATVTALPGVLLCALFALHTQEYDVAFFAVSLSTSLLSFLVFNWHPAQLFMGDVGSLPLGAVWALLLLLMRQELLLPVMAIIPVIETLSVIMQVVSFKTRKKRLFLMAPVHHHFELRGYHETTITSVAGSITLISCMIVFCFYLYT